MREFSVLWSKRLLCFKEALQVYFLSLKFAQRVAFIQFLLAGKVGEAWMGQLTQLSALEQRLRDLELASIGFPGRIVTMFRCYIYCLQITALRQLNFVSDAGQLVL